MTQSKSQSRRTWLRTVVAAPFAVAGLGGEHQILPDNSLKSHPLNPRYDLFGFEGGVSPLSRPSGSCFLVANNHPHQPRMTYIWGAGGTGKTHLLQTTARWLRVREPQLTTHYLTSHGFVQQLTSAIRNGTMDAFRRSLRDTDVFLLDDVCALEGKERALQCLCLTLDWIWDAGGTTIVTASIPPDQIVVSESVRRRYAREEALHLTARCG